MNNWKRNLDLNCSRSMETINKPLDGLLVIDFSQFLSGPSASLRLADLGARVIKIERPETGDICRTLYVSNVELDGDSTIFHAINRNKESFAADLKKKEDFLLIQELIQKADVMIQNFRPGVMDRIGFNYESVKKFNPSIIYGEITGYGTEGPWKDTPGQDLLVQSRSGLASLGGGGNGPLPMGLSIVDMASGAHLAQGLLAALVRRSISGQGAKVEVSLLESILDLQMYQFTAFLNSDSSEVLTNPYPYFPNGIYQTADSYIAIAGGTLAELGEIIGAPELASFQGLSFIEKNEMKSIIEKQFKTKPSKEWFLLLEAHNFSCSEVLHWEQLFRQEGFKELQMIQEICRKNGHSMKTTRCPIRIDGQIYHSTKGSPRIGEDTFSILSELLDVKEGNGNEN